MGLYFGLVLIPCQVLGIKVLGVGWCPAFTSGRDGKRRVGRQEKIKRNEEPTRWSNCASVGQKQMDAYFPGKL